MNDTPESQPMKILYSGFDSVYKTLNGGTETPHTLHTFVGEVGMITTTIDYIMTKR
jgi:hypothetical protein